MAIAGPVGLAPPALGYASGFFKDQKIANKWQGGSGRVFQQNLSFEIHSYR